MDWNKLTVKKLKLEIKKKGLIIPDNGSGKNGSIIKPDLVNLLKLDKPLDIGISNMPLGPTLQILDNLKSKDLINICKTNKKFANICNDDKFWRIRYKRDFPHRYMANYREQYEFDSNANYIMIQYLKSSTNYIKYNLKHKQMLYNEMMKHMLKFKEYIHPNMDNQEKVIFKEYVVDLIQDIIPERNIENTFHNIDSLQEINIKLYEGKVFSFHLFGIYNRIMKTNHEYDDVLFSEEDSNSEDEY